MLDKKGIIKETTENINPHDTLLGYCCACEYDIVKFESLIDKAKEIPLQKAKEGVYCTQCSKDLRTEKNAPSATP